MKIQKYKRLTAATTLSIALVFSILAWSAWAETPVMSGGGHVIQRDAFSSGGMVGRAGGAFQVHDILGQSSPLTYPDTTSGDDYKLTHGFLAPEQYDTLVPQSWIWTELRYVPDTFITVNWMGDDMDSLTGYDSGIMFYDVQYSDDWGTSWNDWLVETIDTTGIFGPGTMGTEYWFRVRATDGIGNIEPYPTAADSIAEATIDYLVTIVTTVAPGGDPLSILNSIKFEHYDTSMSTLAVDSGFGSNQIWCVPTTDLDIFTLSTDSDSLERWFTLDSTSYVTNSAFACSLYYWHQHRIILTLLGTSAIRPADLETFTKFGGDTTGAQSGIYDNWIDNQGNVRFSEFTSGVPIYRTYDTREWIGVTDALIDTINYNYLTTVIRNSFSGIDSGKVMVDGDTVDSPYYVSWEPGIPHTIEAISPQLPTLESRYAFISWNIGSEIRHTIMVTPPYISEYIAFFEMQHPVSVIKIPENPHGWISWDEDTAWGVSRETFWSFFLSEHNIEVSDSDAYSDTIWHFDHWEDSGTLPSRDYTISFPGHTELYALYYYELNDIVLSFDIPDTIWNVGNLQHGESRIMSVDDSIKVVNNGDVPLDWGLWIRDAGVYWAPDSTPSLDHFSLFGRFTLEAEPPTRVDFQLYNDLIMPSMKWSTPTLLGPAGNNVPPSGTNWSYLWFRLRAPYSSSYPTFNEVIKVGILCRAHMP
ncbi:fibronectin type III domain-containing protein [bacterium]|nr:fibronectin type III domain-containing protein [bacterium]